MLTLLLAAGQAQAAIVVHGPTSKVVPEPGAWALMILGFALAGGLLRRRAPRTA